MRKLTILLGVLFVACAAAGPEPVAVKRQAVTECWDPAGLFLVRQGDTTDITRALYLIDALFGPFPKRGINVGGGVHVVVPETCTLAQCDAGQCRGWTCHQSASMTADDGRVGVRVDGVGATNITSALALEPLKLSPAELSEMIAFRTEAVQFSGFTCWEE